MVRVEGPAGKPRSTVRSTAGEPAFTGREAELQAIEAGLRERRSVVIRGAPGYGMLIAV